MNQNKNDNKLEEVPRVRYVGFWCPKCNCNWMIWHRRKESAMQANVYEFTIIEGNTYPEISGFYKEAPEVKELDEDFETGTWTCLECGYVLTDYEGTPLKSVEEVIKYLTIKYDDLGLDGLFAGMDQVLDFLFVDEAGQVSLANLVAIRPLICLSSSAQSQLNIILSDINRLCNIFKVTNRNILTTH